MPDDRNILSELTIRPGRAAAAAPVPRRKRDDFDDVTEIGVSRALPPLGGRFRVLAELGQGGMGTVYRALDLETNREVALKVPHLMGRAIERRFELEVDAIATVVSPSTLGFVARGSADEPFLAMELVRGGSLAQRIAKHGALPERAATIVGRRVGASLAAIHLSGWVHRDVKPGNVVLTNDGGVKLVDFGLARSTDGPGGGTETGQLIGTLGYLAPEQIGVKRVVDPATDVFALGVTFWEALTARKAFTRTIPDIVAGKWAPAVHPVLDVSTLRPPVAAAVRALTAIDPRHRIADGARAVELFLGLDDELAPLFDLSPSKRDALHDIVRRSMRGPVLVRGPSGSGKTLAASAAALVISEIIAPSEIVFVRANPATRARPDGHAPELASTLSGLGLTSAARVVRGEAIDAKRGATEGALVILIDDVNDLDAPTLERVLRLSALGLARVIATSIGAWTLPDFSELKLSSTMFESPVDGLPPAELTALAAIARAGRSFERVHVDAAFAAQGYAPPSLEWAVHSGVLLDFGGGGFAFARGAEFARLRAHATPFGDAIAREIERQPQRAPDVTQLRRPVTAFE
ncbi:MAG: serine/threonine-protein kinase [Polyangiaceae bacterium]